MNTAPSTKGNHVFVTMKPLIALAIFAVFTAASDMPAIAQGEDNGASTTRLDGRCDYRREAENVGPDTGFALCNSVTITRAGAHSAIDYRRALGGSEFRYEGAISGNTMQIARLTIREREPQEASGKCTIYYNRGRISTVTCIAKVGWKTFAANFVVSQINP